ncbi:MAG: hydroxymethylglutaryl-CoA lyase [Proteobacteria bacterium]|nr:hydroxymethylglutaryl-CoA lyase [Pseudomonadota bacterium]
MSDLPQFVEIHEEGPREGFQIEKAAYSLEDRARLIDALSDTGLKSIQVASFVNPKVVPSMADAEALFARINKREGIHYTAVWLNQKGFERAAATPGVHLAGSMTLYASDAFSRKNNNCSAEEMRQRTLDWLKLYDDGGIPLKRAYILTAFGCNFSGEVPLATVIDCVRFIIETCRNQGRDLPEICLADTVGWANPEDVKRRVGVVRETAPGARVGLHLHDTRGLGLANIHAALQMGVDRFDSSVAGLGGCPFAGHGNSRAAGNVCTEDMVFMCHEMGLETGIDLEKLIEAARLAEEIIGRPLSGKIMHSGSLTPYRRRPR